MELLLKTLREALREFSPKRTFSAAALEQHLVDEFDEVYSTKQIRRALLQLQDEKLVILDHKDGSTNMYRVTAKAKTLNEVPAENVISLGDGILKYMQSLDYGIQVTWEEIREGLEEEFDTKVEREELVGALHDLVEQRKLDVDSPDDSAEVSGEVWEPLYSIAEDSEVEEDEEASDDDEDDTADRQEDWIIPAVNLDTEVDVDHSDNEDLHNFYISLAMVNLEHINESIESFNARSDYQSGLVATDLWNRRKHLIMTNAAYFDAAALLMAGFTSAEFNKHHDINNDYSAAPERDESF